MVLPDREQMPYRDCAGVMLFNQDGKVLIGRRKGAGGAANLDGTWQMPQGGIDPGEDPFDGARRELYEETNIASATLIADAPGWVFYDLPDDALGVALKGRFRGQRQMWFAMLFSGADEEIDIHAPGGGRYPAEFAEWRWAELEDLPSIVVPFKREAYEQLVTWFEQIPERIRAGDVPPEPPGPSAA